MSDPKYVRLSDRMARSLVVDISSGWSLAGLDVREFPADESPLCQDFVRAKLRAGVLEPCSKSDFDEVNDLDHDYLTAAGVEVKAASVEGFYQEAHVVGAAEENRRKLEGLRGINSQGLSYKDDAARRQKILAAQKALEGGKADLTEEELQGEQADAKIDGQIEKLTVDPESTTDQQLSEGSAAKRGRARA